MTKHIGYTELDKHFCLPKKHTPFFNFKRLTRKLKKKLLKYGITKRYSFLNQNQKLWYLMEFTNPNYKRFLIKQLTVQHNG